MAELGIKKWHVVVDGDDCVLFLERCDVDTVVNNIDRYHRYGFNIQVEELASRSRPDVEFCQARLIELADGPRYVRDWRKVVSNLGVTKASATSSRSQYAEWLHRMYSVSTVESILNNGVPVLGPSMEVLRKRTLHLMHRAGVRVPRDLWSKDLLQLGSWQWYSGSGRKLTKVPLPITEQARESFRVAFGIPASDQMAYEAQLVDMYGDWNVPDPRAIEVRSYGEVGRVKSSWFPTHFSEYQLDA